MEYSKLRELPMQPSYPTLRKFVRQLKKVPFDLGQFEVRHRTKGKLIAFDMVPDGQGNKALDLGCRDGFWSEKLKNKGYSVTSVDLEPHYATGLRVNADEGLPFGDSEFDLVWCSEVIEHLKNPAFTLGEIKRILKPRGILLMTTPNRGLWIYQFFERIGVPAAALQSEDHVQFLNYGDMKSLLGRFDAYGFFPYMFWKTTIRKHVESLSPTIVVNYVNQK